MEFVPLDRLGQERDVPYTPVEPSRSVVTSSDLTGELYRALQTEYTRSPDLESTRDDRRLMPSELSLVWAEGARLKIGIGETQWTGLADDDAGEDLANEPPVGVSIVWKRSSSAKATTTPTTPTKKRKHPVQETTPASKAVPSRTESPHVPMMSVCPPNAVAYRDANLLSRVAAWPPPPRLGVHCNVYVHAVPLPVFRGELELSLRANGMNKEAIEAKRATSILRLAMLLELMMNKPMLLVGPTTRVVRCGYDVRRQPEYFRLIPGVNEDAHVHANHIVVYALQGDSEEAGAIVLGVGYMYGAPLFNADLGSTRRLRVWDEEYRNDIIAPCVLVSSCMELVACSDIGLATDTVAMVTPYANAPLSRTLSPDARRFLEGVLPPTLRHVLAGRAAPVPAPDLIPCDEFLSNVFGA